MKLIDMIERCSARLQEAGVCFGHGTTNAFDEAAWLVLWRLDLPLDDLDGVAERQLSPAELAAIETLIKQVPSRDEEPGFEPEHRVPMTNGAGQLVKKPKKPKVPGGRGGKNLPSNWEGFDSPAKPARRGVAKPAAKPVAKSAGNPAVKPANKSRPRVTKLTPSAASSKVAAR